MDFGKLPDVQSPDVYHLFGFGKEWNSGRCAIFLDDVSQHVIELGKKNPDGVLAAYTNLGEDTDEILNVVLERGHGDALLSAFSGRAVISSKIERFFLSKGSGHVSSDDTILKKKVL